MPLCILYSGKTVLVYWQRGVAEFRLARGWPRDEPQAANEKFNWRDVNRLLKQQGVSLISAGLDEMPMAYKNIRDAMAAQEDLVMVLGEFMPKLVKMAPSGERPED
jgi:hypothetical protein